MSGEIVIIGAGQAGFMLAQTLRQKGSDAPIRLIGDEPEPPYERPPLSKAFLKGEMEAQSLAFRPAEFYAAKDIALMSGTRVVDIDLESRQIATAKGDRIPYRHLVLATGAEPRRLACAGARLAGIGTLRRLTDAVAWRAALQPGRRLVVIGAGTIGLEVAAAARALGVDTTVVETRERAMARTASPVIAAALTARHRAENVTFVFGQGVAAFEGEQGRLRAVRLEDGTLLPADHALIGIGVEPQTGLARAAGIACGHGILVDALGRTSAADVYAAGDCAEYAHPFASGPLVIESVQNAVDQAKAVASALLGTDEPYMSVPWFWSDQYDWKLQTVGIVAPGDRMIVRGDPESGAFSVCHLRAGRLVAVECLNRPKDYVQARKPILSGAMPDENRLADPDFPLKALIQTIIPPGRS
ncbi:MAG: FAD-dependent oxidoreductase [Rhodothalassiaceae bacterium]